MASDRVALSSESEQPDRERFVRIAVGWLVVVTPVLILPELLWQGGDWFVAAVALMSIVLALRLLAQRDMLPIFAGVFALSTMAAWARAAPHESALTHFAGIALGLLAMATLAAWCRTQGRLALACSGFLLIGIVVLTAGIQSTSVPAPTKYLSVEYLPRNPLSLPGLESGGLINPNALGATALMILPVAVSLALLAGRRVRAQLALRLLASLAALCAGAVALVTQSRSVWIAIWLLVVLAVLRLGRPRKIVMLLVAVVPIGVTLWVRLRLDPTIATVAERISARSTLWRHGLEVLSTAPWFGIGLNEFRHVLFLRTADPERLPHAHNILLQTALDVGLVGLVGYLGVMVWLVIRADATARTGGPPTLVRRVAAGAGLSIVGIHVFGLADAVALGAKVGLFQWLCGGMIIAAWQIQNLGTEPKAGMAVNDDVSARS